MPITPNRPGTALNAAPPIERHYTVAEVAELLNVSDNTVRNLFEDEPVLKIGKPSRLMGGRQKKLVRHYAIMRIPESVLLRVRDGLVHKRPAESSPVPGGRLRTGSSDIHAAS